MSKKTQATDEQQDEPQDDAAAAEQAILESANPLETIMQGPPEDYVWPTMPERFSTGGATADEREQWIAENWPYGPPGAAKAEGDVAPE
jgi:hypothetical protein